MPRVVVTCALLVALLLPSTALGASSSSSSPIEPAANTGAGLPLAPVRSAFADPPGFTSDAAQAMTAAEGTSKMQALHRSEHPLRVYPLVASGRYWAVEFVFNNQIVAEVDVSRAGRATHVWTGPLAVAGYARGHYGGMFDSWWVILPFSLLFLVPFVNPRRILRLRHLDALVVLSFFVSYWLFDHAHLEAAVWLVYPPLIYLLVRMGLLGLRGSRSEDSPGRSLSPVVLGAGLVLLVVVRVVLSLVDHDVIDVGYASVIGAHRIVHGQSLYYSSLGNPDTYGPVAYLAYVPFELLFPWHGSWDYLPAAHAASIVFDLVTVGGLVALGRRLRTGREGTRLGLTLGWAWAACPFTLLGLMEHSNDGLIAMLSVICLLVFFSPTVRGAVLGLGAAAKFTPAALLPLFAGRRDRGLKGVLECTGAFLLVALGAIALYLPSGGISEFWNHTIGFQLTRTDVFSPWALHPGLAPVKVALEVGAILFALAVAMERRPRSLVQVSALAAAVTIAVQIPAVHWFYYYIIWFMPFLLVAMLAGPAPPAPPTSDPEEALDLNRDEHEPVPLPNRQLAGV